MAVSEVHSHPGRGDNGDGGDDEDNEKVDQEEEEAGYALADSH